MELLRYCDIGQPGEGEAPRIECWWLDDSGLCQIEHEPDIGLLEGEAFERAAIERRARAFGRIEPDRGVGSVRTVRPESTEHLREILDVLHEARPGIHWYVFDAAQRVRACA